MIDKQKLTKILEQVPPNYYDLGIRTNPLQKVWHNWKFAVFKSLIKDKEFKHILDIGCAGGFMTGKIANILPKSRIVAIDAYSQAINYAQKRHPKIKFLVADAHKLPFKNNSFDLVVCYETIEHVVNPSIVLQEIRRVLTKDGTAIIAMDSGSLPFRVVWFVWEKTKGKVWQGAHLHPFHHTELEKTIKKARLKIEKKTFSHLGMEVSFVLKK